MNESNFLGVSVRAWIAIFTVFTVCVMSFLGKEIEEPLYTLVLTVSAFYLGKMSNTK